MQFERRAPVPHRTTSFRFYSLDELDGMPDTALRDLEERVTAHRNRARRARGAGSFKDPLASTDVLVAMIKREQDWRTRTQQSLPAQGGKSNHDASCSRGGADD